MAPTPQLARLVMRQHSAKSGKETQQRSRIGIALMAALFVLCASTIAFWLLTTLGLIYALACATPITVVVACGVVLVEPVADVFAAILDAIVALCAAIAEAIGAVIAVLLAAVAAVFGIFGG